MSRVKHRPTSCTVALTLALVAVAPAARADTAPVLQSAPEVTPPPGVNLPEGASVRVMLVIDETGAVTEAQVVEGIDPETDAIVLEAARRMRFTPATHEGNPTRSRVRFRYRLHTQPRPAPAPVPVVVLVPPRPVLRIGARPRAPVIPATPSAPAPSNEPGVTVRSRREPGAATRETLRAEELTTVPGTFGEPLRVIASLPGVGRSPLGVGFFLVRGASFENTGFIVDDFPVLNLYHFGAGPSVLSPNFVSELDFYPGNYPLAYGRFSAGLISVRTELRPTERPRLDLQVDLFRASAFGQISFDRGRGVVAIAARRSYFDPFLSLFAPGVELSYGDAQFRVEYAFSPRVRAMLFVFTSADAFSVGDLGPFLRSDRRSGLHYAFTRAIGRLEYRAPAGFQASWSAMVGGDNVQVLQGEDTGTEVATLQGAVVGQRLNARFNTSRFATSSLGIDMLGQVYDVTNTARADTVPPTQLTQLSFAAYYEQVLRLGRLELTAGLRADYVRFRDTHRTLPEPRLVARVRVHPLVTAVLGSGIFHQLPNALLMVAGFNLPPQRAWQNSLGVELSLGAQFEGRVTGYYNWLFDLPGGRGGIVPGIGAAGGGGGVTLPSTTAFNGQGRAYGLEFFLRRRLEHGLYGWVTYTLSRSERYTPGNEATLFTYDQTHVVNLALSWRVNERWRLGLRFQFASGTPTPAVDGGIWDVDRRTFSPYLTGELDRNPISHQLDLRADYMFRTGPFRMNFFIDVINSYNNQNGDLGWTYRFDWSQRQPAGGLPLLPTVGLRAEY